jgi:hypothetical protein
MASYFVSDSTAVVSILVFSLCLDALKYSQDIVTFVYADGKLLRNEL